MNRRGWAELGARTAVVGGAGGLIGWVISLDVDWSVKASYSQCAPSPGICIGTNALAGLALGVAFTIAACWITMAAAGIRPLLVTVPTAIVFVWLAIVLFPRPGGRLHPAWAFGLLTGCLLALIAAPLAGAAIARRGQ